MFAGKSHHRQINVGCHRHPKFLHTVSKNVILNVCIFNIGITLGERIVVHFEGYFREAIWPILFLGQCFGIMPVIGIKVRLISNVRFKWKSLRTLYSFFVLITVASYTLLVAWKTISVNIEFSAIGLYFE